MISGLTILSYR